jgi:DNA/RNA endonuclease YhcR with UshA esterase domain
MSFSNYLETELLDHVFAGNAYSSPSNLYLSLHTANPDEDASGAEVSTSGTAYARTAVTFTVSGNTATTNAAVEFATATANFGTVTHVAVWDASTSGNMLAYAALTSSKTIETGDVFRVPAGDLDITLD